MQSATSFFNRALFGGSLRRSWPLWLLYTLVWLLALPLPLINQMINRSHIPFETADAAYYTLSLGLRGGIWIGFFFGVSFAMAMFAYLTSPRATQGFHAMPVRRETLYVTGYLTGLFCQLLSLVLIFTLTGISTVLFGYFDSVSLLVAFAAAALAVVFFYSFGVFCLMFTGQILAVPAFYLILNILAVGMEVLVRTFAGNFLYGYSGTTGAQPFDFLSPLWKLLTEVHVISANEPYYSTYISPAGISAAGGVTVEGMRFFVLYALAGLVFALFGLLIYRRRASEASGSTVAIRWACPFFKYGMATCAAFLLGQVSYYLLIGSSLSQGDYSLPGALTCMLLSGLFGYFAAEMLLKKSFRVWRSGRTGALVFSAVLICFGISLSFDLTGYEGYVPPLDDVQSADFTLHTNGYSFYHGPLHEKESIARIETAHQALIADKERQLHNGNEYDSALDDSYLYFTVTYTLTDGRIVRRSYDNCRIYARELADPDSVASAMTALANNPETVRLRLFGDLDEENYSFTGGSYYAYTTDPDWSSTQTESNGELTSEQTKALYAALKTDLREGNASSDSLFEDDRDDSLYIANVDLWYVPANRSTSNSSSEGVYGITVTVTERLSNAYALLTDFGVFDEIETY